MKQIQKILLSDTGHIELYGSYNDLAGTVRSDFLGAYFSFPYCWRVPYNQYNLGKAFQWAKENSLQIGPAAWLDPDTYEQRILIPIYRESEAVIPHKPLGPIPGMCGTLRKYQEAAVEYALRRRCCIIADDPGVGKSIEAMAAIAEAHAFPAIVVCPPSLIPKWKDEITKFFPSWLVQPLIGQDIKANNKIYIVGYSGIKKYGEAIKRLKPMSIIFDESHYLKGYMTERATLSCDITRTIKYRFLLTSTPIVNMPSDLMSQLRVLGRWDVLVGVPYFSEMYCGTNYLLGDRSPTGATNLDKLKVQLRRYCMIRRTSKQLKPELPDREIVSVYLEADSNIRNQWAGYYSSQEFPSLRRNAFDRKRASVQKWLYAKTYNFTGKAVIFGFHRDYIEEIAEIFSAPAITGAHSTVQNRKIVEIFREDLSAHLLFLTYNVGSQGWQLDVADRVVLIEYDWSDATHSRAEGRLNSLIRERPIRIYRLLVENSIEDDIVRTAAKKKRIIDETLGV
jgi:SWI/SNF-related matrix-associated actin-dependent regulator 1 of chromatin subfamily A